MVTMASGEKPSIEGEIFNVKVAGGQTEVCVSAHEEVYLLFPVCREKGIFIRQCVKIAMRWFCLRDPIHPSMITF